MIKKKSRETANEPEAEDILQAAPRRLVKALLVVGGLFALVLIGGGFILADWWLCLPDEATATYVGRGKCIECHRDQAHAFEGSHHDLAMDRATDETVLAAFDGSTVEHFGITSRMYRDGKRFMVHTEGHDGKMADFEVKYVFGVTPLQQYMVEFDRPKDMPDSEIARLQVLRLSWDTLKKKWFYLPAPDVDEKLAPDDDLHWTGIAQRWNTMCADCHSTNLQKNYDADTGVYHTTFSEIDVSCEACHGPGSNHVKLAEEKLLFWDRKQGYGLAKLKSESSKPQIDTCARCHSRRRIVHPDFRAGSSYYDYYSNELLMENTYHADGQILDEVYVYGSFIQSKMFHKGIRCTDCHDPHTARLKHEGNNVCTSCHQHPAGKYDTPAHHRHNSGSTGASCVECHMPAKTYMEVDPRRDHSLRIPRPDLSVKVGTPNACTGCHIDPAKVSPEKREKLHEYADWLLAAREGDEEIKAELARLDQWAAGTCAEWYGTKTADEPHFAEALAPARNDDPKAVQPLEKVAHNRYWPAIARATAVVELGRFSPLENNHLVEEALTSALMSERKAAREKLLETLQPYRDALRDPSPQVRAAAIGHFEPYLSNLQNSGDRIGQTVEYFKALTADLVPMLADDTRLVRTEAGRVLARVPLEVLPHVLSFEDRERLKQAIEDYKAGVLVDNDRAAAHLTLGILYENLGQDDLAEKAYQRGIRVEPGAVGPRANLAGLYERQRTQAEQGYRQATQQRNDAAMEYFAKEVVKHQEQVDRLRREELTLLERDARLAPDNAVVQYRYGLTLYLNDRLGDAEKALEKAWKLEPRNHQFLAALVGLYEQQERWQEGLPLVKKLLELEPNYVPYQNWLQVFEQHAPQQGPAQP